MNLIRHNPWNIFDQLNYELGNYANGRTKSDHQNNVVDWSPSVDIQEGKNEYTLHADLPGVNPKEIEVTAESGVLIIKGERNGVATDNNDGYQKVERHYGVFTRKFTLPETADADNIKAKSDNGVLQITIPKREVSKAKRITVN